MHWRDVAGGTTTTCCRAWRPGAGICYAPSSRRSLAAPVRARQTQHRGHCSSPSSGQHQSRGSSSTTGARQRASPSTSPQALTACSRPAGRSTHSSSQGRGATRSAPAVHLRTPGPPSLRVTAGRRCDGALMARRSPRRTRPRTGTSPSPRAAVGARDGAARHHPVEVGALMGRPHRVRAPRRAAFRTHDKARWVPGGQQGRTARTKHLTAGGTGRPSGVPAVARSAPRRFGGGRRVTGPGRDVTGG
jgi:hypothetical protein